MMWFGWLTTATGDIACISCLDVIMFTGFCANKCEIITTLEEFYLNNVLLGKGTFHQEITSNFKIEIFHFIGYRVGSDKQAVPAVTTAQLAPKIIDDTFGFRYCKLSINNSHKKRLKLWQILSLALIYKRHNKIS